MLLEHCLYSDTNCWPLIPVLFKQPAASDTTSNKCYVSLATQLHINILYKYKLLNATYQQCTTLFIITIIIFNYFSVQQNSKVN